MAGAVLDGFEVHAGGFLLAVVIFTVTMALLMPFLAVQLRRMGSGALGGVALIASLASLILTAGHLRRPLDRRRRHVACGRGDRLGRRRCWQFFILPYLGLKKYLEER